MSSPTSAAVGRRKHTFCRAAAAVAAPVTGRPGVARTDNAVWWVLRRCCVRLTPRVCVRRPGRTASIIWLCRGRVRRRVGIRFGVGLWLWPRPDDTIIWVDRVARLWCLLLVFVFLVFVVAGRGWVWTDTTGAVEWTSAHVLDASCVLDFLNRCLNHRQQRE